MEKKVTRKEEIKNEKTLLATFIGLIVLVAILGVIALNLDNIHKDNDQDLIIPILEANSESELSVEISNLKKGAIKQYILVVSNYKDKEILKKAITYDVDITPSETATVKVYKNESSDNLITENDLLIENNKLKADERVEDIYKIVIEAKEDTNEHDKITIKINS